MKAAIVQNSTIINIVEASNLADARALFGSGADVITLPSGAAIGWVRSAGEWSASNTTQTYRSIDKVEAMGLIRAVTSMTPAQELAFRDDPNLALFWRIWREDVGNVIHRDHPLTATILGALKSAGYLSQAQSQAVLDNWPTA